jgi:two-component system LytT family response regulator
MRVLIIDDHADSREKLEFLLKKYFDEIDLLPPADSGKAGIDAVNTLHPELVFLDIELGDMTAFEMLERVDDITFHVVFCTAYDKYAIKAIRFHALDYILKPVGKDDLTFAISQVQNASSTQPKDLLRSAGDSIKERNEYKPDKIALSTKEGYLFKSFESIIHLDADRNYTYFYFTDQDKVLVSKPIKEFEELLTQNGFFRVHHSHLININQVEKYIRGDGGYVILSNGKAISVARNRKDEFLSLFEKRS